MALEMEKLKRRADQYCELRSADRQFVTPAKNPVSKPYKLASVTASIFSTVNG